MANELLKVSTELLNLVEQQWSPRFHKAANERAKISKHFMSATEGVSKIGNRINISKVGTVSAQTGIVDSTIATSLNRASLVYASNTELSIPVTATFIYAGFQLPKITILRMLREPAYRAALKEQVIAGLTTNVDVAAAALAAGLTTNVIGGAGQNLTKSLLLSGIAKLRAGAKEYFEIGEKRGYLAVTTMQIDDLFSIPEITAADIRGDSANPNVTGKIWPAWNLEIMVSGNISQSGGVAHNLLWIPEAFVVGWNQKYEWEQPQHDGFITAFLASADFGVAEMWDEYAVDIQTLTT